MSKKTSKKRAMKSEKPKELAPNRKIDHAKGESPEENNMDFGGIPERDLKKNLGCG